jgi:hypothetical protein
MCRVESPNGTRGAIAPAPTREEAAAIIASVARFMRATAPRATAPAPDLPDPWSRAAIVEGVARHVQSDLRDPWISG